MGVTLGNRWVTSGARQRTTQALESRYSQVRREEKVETPEGLDELRQRHPGFDVQAFLSKVSRAFVEVQHAWSDRRLGDVARHMSDGVLRRFHTQLALNKLHGDRNVTADVRILDATVVRAEVAGAFDTLHVKFRATLRDATVDDDVPEAEARSEAARAPATEFVEYWSFVRRSDAQDTPPAQGRCPSCGAAVPLRTGVACEHCRAALNSGAHDWVLSEITQEHEFSTTSAATVEGWLAFVEQDPAADRQVLEDRAALVFWKWIEAQATGKTGPFARLCAPDALAGVEPRKAGVFAQAAVGAVDLLAVKASPDGARAFFEVRWSTTGAGTGIVRRDVLELVRAPGVKTNHAAGLATDRCHHCNAPQADSDAVTCSYCAALLPQDWSFQALHSYEHWRSTVRAQATSAGPSQEALLEHLGQLADPHERRRALVMMVGMARADGVVTESERALLEACARRWSLEQGRLEALLEIPLDQLAPVVPRSPEEARDFYRALAGAALIDGKVDREEKKLLGLMAMHLKIPPEEAVRIQAELKALAQAA